LPARSRGEYLRSDLYFHRSELVEQRINPYPADLITRGTVSKKPHISHSGLFLSNKKEPTKRQPKINPTRTLLRIPEPLSKSLIGKTVCVFPNEILIVGERQINDEVQDRKNNEVDRNYKKPFVSKFLCPIANSGRKASGQKQNGYQQCP
jgi:hypothetical protein